MLLEFVLSLHLAECYVHAENYALPSNTPQTIRAESIIGEIRQSGDHAILIEKEKEPS